MKASEQYTLAVLFVMSMVVLTLSMDETLCKAIQMKALAQYFHVVLFTLLYKMVLTFKFVDETQCVTIQINAVEHWKLSCSTVYYAVQGFVLSLGETLVCDHSNESYWRAISRSEVCFNILENCNLELNYEFAFYFYSIPLYLGRRTSQILTKIRSFTTSPDGFLKDLTLSQQAERASLHGLEKWKTRNHFISTVFKAELYPNCTRGK